MNNRWVLDEIDGRWREHDNYEYLYQQGVACIFGPGTKIPQAAREVLSAVREKTKVAA